MSVRMSGASRILNIIEAGYSRLAAVGCGRVIPAIDFATDLRIPRDAGMVYHGGCSASTIDASQKLLGVAA